MQTRRQTIESLQALVKEETDRNKAEVIFNALIELQQGQFGTPKDVEALVTAVLTFLADCAPEACKVLRDAVALFAIEADWEVWTYDVWGNADDGWEVNNRFCDERHHKLTLRVETCNAGTDREFKSASPTDEQIRDLFGPHAEDSGDGDDRAVYVVDSRNDEPLGEMLLVSHGGLSPIKLLR
jgi:hypothetical protein